MSARKAVLVAVSVVLVLGLVLSLACAKSAPAPSPAPAPKPPAAAPAPKAPAPSPAASPKPAPAAKPTAPAAAAPKPAPGSMVVNIFGGGPGTEPQIAGQAASDIAKKRGSVLRITSAESPGYIYNLDFVDSNPAMWENTVIGTTAATYYLATKGWEPFKRSIVGFKYLLAFLKFGAVTVSTDPNLKTQQDLVGKKVALGYPTQITFNVLPRYLWKSLGIQEKIQIQAVGSTPAMNAVIDGLASACVVHTYVNVNTGEIYPTALITELGASGKRLNWLDFGKENLEKTIKDTGLPFEPLLIPAGKLKDQTKDIYMQGEVHVWAAKDTFPEEKAYEFVKLHLETYAEYGKYLKLLEAYSPKTFVQGLNKRNIHPGALRAFEEAKITIPDR